MILKLFVFNHVAEFLESLMCLKKLLQDSSSINTDLNLKKGCPYVNAVKEITFNSRKIEFIKREKFMPTQE